ncbi:MAG: M14 family metallocarboxypeptidase [Rhodobacteraceae bacterium]|nr:M14 family metallocarboxypeptidase [Paracoccaceae bacterium]
MSQRLGRNRGAYLGDTIDIESVLGDALSAAQAHGWRLNSISATPSISLHTLHRLANRADPGGAPRRIYLSTGIHGDEPAGPLAMARLLRENPWPDDVELWCCPCLNPTAFPRNTRENAQGVDLNRDYRRPQSPEVRAHVEWLNQQPDFDLCFCCTRIGSRRGFTFMRRRGGQPSHSEAMAKAVELVCPLDLSPEIEGRPAKAGSSGRISIPTPARSGPKLSICCNTRRV